MATYSRAAESSKIGDRRAQSPGGTDWRQIAIHPGNPVTIDGTGETVGCAVRFSEEVVANGPHRGTTIGYVVERHAFDGKKREVHIDQRSYADREAAEEYLRSIAAR